MHITTKILILLVFLSVVASIIFDSLLQSFQPLSVLVYAVSFVVYFLIIMDQECVAGIYPCFIWGWAKFLITFTLLAFFIVLKSYNGIKLYTQKLVKKTPAKSPSPSPSA